MSKHYSSIGNDGGAAQSAATIDWLTFIIVGKIVFITGTDTGVGKTVFTAAFLAYLRSLKQRAWALKPFCSGTRADVLLLDELQDHELALETVNPVYFPEPVAPLVAARKRRRKLDIRSVVAGIEALRSRCDWLLIEGCGGVLVPLSETHSVLDFIAELGSPVIVVGKNKLGVINHAVLTVQALEGAGIPLVGVVLMEPARRDLATKTNQKLLAEMVKPVTVFSFRHLGRYPKRARTFKNSLAKLKKSLAPVVEMGILAAV